MEPSHEVSISKIGAAVYICWGVVFLFLVVVLFCLGMTPSQRWVTHGDHKKLISCLFIVAAFVHVLRTSMKI